MNTAIITPASPTRRLPRWTSPGRFLRAALAVARVRSTRLDVLDPWELHELRQDAERLRTDNFRTVAVGRLL